MTRLFAISTSDASLMCCELERARHLLALDDEGLVLGLGAYDDSQLIQRQYGVGVTRSDMWELPTSETALYTAGPPPVGRPIEESAQPFRMRQWLFSMAGTLKDPHTRERLAEQLPDFLQRSLRGPTVEEAVFATFLSELRTLGRTEDPDLEAPIAAQLLARTAQHVEEAAGQAHKASIALIATNGRVLLAATRGGHPLSYRLLEGEGACSRCGLTGDEKAATPLVRDHRRRRSIVFATDPLKPDAWLPVPEAKAVAVGRALQLQIV